jgi:aerobic-type carbon monoxide dehydrogenase small subunit (CoxS/CutS family)
MSDQFTALSLHINGTARDVAVEPRQTLLDLLRDVLMLTGSKRVCEMGNCGACTVLVDGDAMYSCLLLAIDCAGREITTIEGLATGDELDSVQQAFIEADAFQCGFCTPGQIMSMRGLLNHNPSPTIDEITHAMSGNLCRCGAYPNIVKAGERAVVLERARANGGGES